MTSESTYQAKFDDLPPNQRAEMARAASQFLLGNDYVSMDEACEALNMTLQEVWDKILDEANLPRCEHPGFGMVC
jgi:hypothetical protein